MAMRIERHPGVILRRDLIRGDSAEGYLLVCLVRYVVAAVDSYEVWPSRLGKEN